MEGLEIRPLSLPQDRALLRQALELHRLVLGPMTRLRLFSCTRGRRPILLVALWAGQVVGFKFGFEDRPRRFHSWLGGVHPDHRRQGIATALMQAQHDLARERGYRVVRTHTRNSLRAMLLLNLRQGFDIVGTITPPKGELRILLEKRLAG